MRDPKKSRWGALCCHLDLQSHMNRMTGVDLSKIDGIDG
jgi:hypothetical protein